MKKVISLCLAVCLLFGIPVLAETTEKILDPDLGFYYEIINAEEIRILGVNKEIYRGETLSIPDILAGYSPHEIADDAFFGTDFKEVSLSSNIEKIGERAFAKSNVKSIIIPANVKEIGSDAFAECDDLVIFGERESYAEKYAAENSILFEADNEETFESKYDISQFMDSTIYKIYDVFDTDYGAVVYCSMGGMMRAPGPGISLVRENGESVNLSSVVSKEDLFSRPMHNDIKLSEDGKYVTFNVSFDERAEGAESMLGGDTIVYHDAGTYYYKSDLEKGVTIETHFEPKDTLGEDVISSWAKPEVEKAIDLGFVPTFLRDNYKRNITRAEFAKMAMDFLSFSYGYSNATRAKGWSEYDYTKEGYVNTAFLDAYCHTKPDRNGQPFMSGNHVYEYNSMLKINMAEPFEKTDDFLYYDSVIKAYNIGIVNGISETEFNPNGDITRQEAAAMLMRVYKNYAVPESITKDYLFADNNEIADWAKEDVYSINMFGVMQGVGNDMFAPLDNYTVEQAIATFLRLYEVAPVSRKNKNIAPLLDMEFEIEKVLEGNPAGRAFVTSKRKDSVFDDYTIIQGVWNERHYGGTDIIYVFYKSGGVTTLGSGQFTSDAEIDADKNTIKYSRKIDNTFCLYNKLNGTKKVYDKGEYMYEIDIETGNILRLERIS